MALDNQPAALNKLNWTPHAQIMGVSVIIILILQVIIITKIIIVIIIIITIE